MSALVETPAPQQAPLPVRAAPWTLAGLLRTGGAAALVVALAQFLLIGVQVDNDLQRFGLLLLQTGLFTAGAFVLQRFLQDAKSARLLLGVSLVSVVAGFAVLGAMLYSSHPFDVAPVPIDRGWPWPSASPDTDALSALTQWRTGSAIETLIAALAAALVLLPTARFGFAVLVRASAQRLTLLTALASLALLVPVRDPLLTGLLAAGTLLAVSAAQRGMVDRDPVLATAEGRFARAIPFLPVGIVIVRTVLLHEVDPGFVLPLSVALWFMVRTVLTAAPATAKSATRGYAAGMVASVTAATALSTWLEPALDGGSVALMMLVASLATLELRRHVSATSGVLALDGLALLSAGLLLAGTTAAGSVIGFRSVWLIVATLPLVGHAAFTRRPVLVALLLCLAGWQSLMLGEHVLALLDGHLWQSLIGIGLVAIASAGWVERRRSGRRDAAVAPAERGPSFGG